MNISCFHFYKKSVKICLNHYIQYRSFVRDKFNSHAFIHSFITFGIFEWMENCKFDNVKIFAGQFTENRFVRRPWEIFSVIRFLNSVVSDRIKL